MYIVTETDNNRILQIMQPCTKKFIVNNELVKIPKSGIVVFPKNTEIFVGKILHHVFHKIQMAKNRQNLYHNSTICQYHLGEMMSLDMEEILLASIEIEEKI